MSKRVFVKKFYEVKVKEGYKCAPYCDYHKECMCELFNQVLDSAGVTGERENLRCKACIVSEAIIKAEGG